MISEAMRLWLILVILAVCDLLCARVVINEVCYDAHGADAGKEWIELYNASDSNVDLSSWKIYSGGSSFGQDFEFPYFVLRPGHFVLIGGDEVPNRHFTHNFSFQNGGTASDGIRLVNADSTYTDTVIYDSPNANSLIDDSGLPATSFAEDAAEGCSLARVMDGWDTDLCAEDFIVESQPTPGLPNRVYADYALQSYQILDSDNGLVLQLYLINLSQYKPAIYAELGLYENAQLVHSEEVPPLEAGEARIVEIWLEDGFELLYAELELEHDPNPANNSLYISTMGGSALAPVINEILPVPESGKQEFIELYAEAASKTSTSYLITDEAENRITFTLPPIPGYFVLCQDKESMLQDYPECPAGFVIEVNSWAALNNDGDSLLLWDESEEIVIDAMIYGAAQAVSGMALQRLLDQDETVIWRVSSPNPGQDNNIHQHELPEHAQKLKIFGSPCDPSKGESITISYKLTDPANLINCSIYDLLGHKIRCLADNQLVADQGVLNWDGRKQNGSYAKRGLYIILWESQSSERGKVMRKQLSAVIR
jgi:hypothetical protein